MPPRERSDSSQPPSTSRSGNTSKSKTGSGKKTTQSSKAVKKTAVEQSEEDIPRSSGEEVTAASRASSRSEKGGGSKGRKDVQEEESDEERKRKRRKTVTSEDDSGGVFGGDGDEDDHASGSEKGGEAGDGEAEEDMDIERDRDDADDSNRMVADEGEEEDEDEGEGGGGTRDRKTGDRMVLAEVDKGSFQLTHEQAYQKLEELELLEKPEAIKSLLIQFMTSDQAGQQLLMFLTLIELKENYQSMSTILRKDWTPSSNVTKMVGELCRVLLLCGFFLPEKPEKFHGNLLVPLTLHLRDRQGLPEKWVTEPDIKPKVESLCREKISEAKKKFGEIVIKDKKKSLDVFLKEYIPNHKISRRMAHIAAYYITVFLSTDTDEKTKKIQPAAGFIHIMEDLKDRQKDFKEMVEKEGKDGNVRAQTKFLEYVLPSLTCIYLDS